MLVALQQEYSRSAKRNLPSLRRDMDNRMVLDWNVTTTKGGTQPETAYHGQARSS